MAACLFLSFRTTSLPFFLQGRQYTSLLKTQHSVNIAGSHQIGPSETSCATYTLEIGAMPFLLSPGVPCNIPGPRGAKRQVSVGRSTDACREHQRPYTIPADITQSHTLLGSKKSSESKNSHGCFHTAHAIDKPCFGKPAGGPGAGNTITPAKVQTTDCEAITL